MAHESTLTVNPITRGSPKLSESFAGYFGLKTEHEMIRMMEMPESLGRVKEDLRYRKCTVDRLGTGVSVK
jgi:hypothetical protein